MTGGLREGWTQGRITPRMNEGRRASESQRMALSRLSVSVPM
jgi:hypothetical protein